MPDRHVLYCLLSVCSYHGYSLQNLQFLRISWNLRGYFQIRWSNNRLLCTHLNPFSICTDFKYGNERLKILNFKFFWEKVEKFNLLSALHIGLEWVKCNGQKRYTAYYESNRQGRYSADYMDYWKMPRMKFNIL